MQSKGLSKAQKWVLVVAVLVSASFLVMGYNLRKMQEIQVEFQLPGFTEMFANRQALLAVIQIHNSTIIPFWVQSVQLKLKSRQNKTIALLHNLKPQSIQSRSKSGRPRVWPQSKAEGVYIAPLKSTRIPIGFHLSDQVRLRDLIAQFPQGFIVEGEIRIRVLAFNFTLPVRKHYELSKLFKDNR